MTLLFADTNEVGPKNTARWPSIGGGRDGCEQIVVRMKYFEVEKRFGMKVFCLDGFHMTFACDLPVFNRDCFQKQ